MPRKPARRNLCLAGGVALNCVANGKVLRDGRFESIWVQPAAGDAGGALGAALATYHLHADRPRASVERRWTPWQGAYLGPEFRAGRDRDAADGGRRPFRRARPRRECSSSTAQALADGKAVGWFQGRMEFGPRALGNRSILGDPRDPTMQKTLNLKVKYRESFRPFAPSVLREDVADWFDLDVDSPYMLLVAPIADEHRRAMTAEEQALFGIDKLNVPRSSIPAVTHVDYSARVQTVHAETNPLYYDADQTLRGADRLSGAGQHQLQRAQRADRVHARGRVSLLHGNGNRHAGGGQLLFDQRGTRSWPEVRLPRIIRG